MSSSPLISICIPTYNRISDLAYLLDTIKLHTFTDFEVVVTDDSTTNEVRDFCAAYQCNFPLLYFKNTSPLGTPENWNEGFRKASGKWVKLMHDDDYFNNEDALSKFANEIQQHPDIDCFYSAFTFENKEKNTRKTIKCNIIDQLILSASPYHLLKRNYFGNPSCVILKKATAHQYQYDKRLKYIVDFAFYMDLLLNKIRCKYINKPLIIVGINEAQVTNYTFNNIQIQMYENHILFEKIGPNVLNNIIGFDYYWRIYRKFKIKSADQVKPYYNQPLNKRLIDMISFQQKIPHRLLLIGLCSKFFMSICYLKYRLSKY